MGVDENTGEVRNVNGLTDDELLNYEPVTPEQVEQLIVIIGNRLEDSIPVLKELLEARYAAESKYIEERAKAMLRSDQSTVTRARAEADIASLPFRHAYDNARTTLHAAEALQDALKAKLYGYLNINKAQASAYQSYARR